MTMIIAIIVLLFASIKLIELNDKKNPVVSSYEEPHPTDRENPINLNKVGFRLAISWEDVWPDKLTKDDPAFVK